MVLRCVVKFKRLRVKVMSSHTGSVDRGCVPYCFMVPHLRLMLFDDALCLICDTAETLEK